MSGIALGSLFDGSGGFPLAGRMCGIEPVWASEIEPYPIAVTRARFPDMEHLGDVREVSGAEIEPVDVITFGSPCQDMSVAGKRAGMRHEGKGDEDTTRSGLFYESVRIIREMRAATNGRYPAFAVWENVPGAFSSNRGEDFRCVLEEIARIADGGVSVPLPAGGKWLSAGEILGDGFSIAWRVLDAQYWGVPQRRKRIYLVADFAGERAGKILFEREGMRGDSEPGEEAREGIAGDASGGTGGSDRAGLSASFMGGQGHKAGGLGYADEVSPTLKATPSGTNAVPDVVYAIQGNAAERDAKQNGLGISENASPILNRVDRHSVVYPAVALTLTAEYDSSPCVDRGQNVICHAAGFNDATGERAHGSMEYCDERYPTLRAGDVKAVVYDARGNGYGRIVPTITGDHENRVTDYTALCVGNGQLHNISMAEQANTLDCMHDRQAVLTAGKPPRRFIVRRLTPVECARLQGFPDVWGDLPRKESITDGEAVFWEDVRRTYAAAMGRTYRPFRNSASLLKWYNSLHTDSSEYKMWGNGIALPCAAFVLEGIAMELQAHL